ncbi:unnamed protein product [Camellia sinensis]
MLRTYLCSSYMPKRSCFGGNLETEADSAIAALNYSGVGLGSLPISTQLEIENHTFLAHDGFSALAKLFGSGSNSLTILDSSLPADCLTEVVWEGGETETKADSNTMKKADNNSVSNAVNSDWKMVPGLKSGRLRKKTLTQPETDSPVAIPLG